MSERASDAFARRSWHEAFAELATARETGTSSAEDLERLAVAAYMVGHDAASETAWMDAHRAWARLGEPERAAGCAFRHALGLYFRGALAPAGGWVARGRRVLEQSDRDCIERAWLRMLEAVPRLFEGDAGAGHEFAEAERVAVRLRDDDAATFARLGLGHSLVSQGSTADGMALLDEVMVAVTTEEVSPVIAGIAYCQVIALCQAVLDVRRAREWTIALSRWCDSQPGLVPFRGNCLVHRCEIFQLVGAWPDALDEAARACELLAGPPAWDSLGAAHYQLGEIRRLRGELAEAEESFQRASVAGREPEPGLSLLRLAQGRTDVAHEAIRRALEDSLHPTSRYRLLPALVVIALAAGDVEAARQAADELSGDALRLDAPYLRAVATQARGAVLLAEGQPRAARTALRETLDAWRELEAPYDAARTRMLLAVACEQLGDADGATLEREAAGRAFAELGAAIDLEQLAAGRGGPRDSGPLSTRETQVLTLVAAGMSNKTIALELVISEKTVARHVSNILAKLGLASRTEATAYAFRHGLVR
jgi:DNA-binding NarL/FixJ family response regulator